MYKQAIINELYKQADSVDDSIRGTLVDFAVDSALPGVGTAADLAGILSGKYNAKSNLKDIIKADKSPELSYIPGVDSYRKIQRAKYVEKALNKNKKKDVTLSEVLGPYTSGILATGIGAGIGGLSSKDKLKGIRNGAMIGGGTAIGMHLIGLLAGAIRKKRSLEEQEEYYKGSTLPNYLIPGISRYNLSKSTELINDVANKRKKKK